MKKVLSPTSLAATTDRDLTKAPKKSLSMVSWAVSRINSNNCKKVIRLDTGLGSQAMITMLRSAPASYCFTCRRISGCLMLQTAADC